MKPGDVVHLDDLTGECGYFRRKLIEADREAMQRESFFRNGVINNGYLCDHPDNEERRTAGDGSTVGCCFAWACPLAYSLDPSDRDDAKLMQKAGADPRDEEWVQLHSPVRANEPALKGDADAT